HIAERVPGVIYEARLTPDGHTVISFVNHAVRDLFDVEPADLMRDPRVLFDGVHPDDKARVLASLAASARDLVPWREVHRVVLPRQGVRWLSVEAMPQREPDGTVIWHGFTTDVTERRLDE